MVNQVQHDNRWWILRRSSLLLPLAAIMLGTAGCDQFVITPGDDFPTNGSSDTSSYSGVPSTGQPDNSGLPLIVASSTPTCDVTSTTAGSSALGKTVAAGKGTVIPNSYIVVLQDNVDPATVANSAAAAGVFAKGTAPRVMHSAIQGFSGTFAADEVQRLQRDPRVKYIEPDYHISVKSEAESASTQYGQVEPWGVRHVGGSRDGTGRTAWIIDTGIDLYNADLNVDQQRSRNFVDDGHSDAMDYDGHGTHVAGIIGARNNSIGVVGVAPNANLVSVRVLDDSGSGSYADIIAGIDYVTANAHPGDVINMSLGGPASRAIDDAVRRAANKGILIAVAAGNEADDAESTSPARLNYTGVYTVSAVDSNGVFASFSNYGSPVDVAAPGVKVLSTRLGGGLVYMSGTSMATPHVAGLLLFGRVHGNGYAYDDYDGCADPLAYE